MSVKEEDLKYITDANIPWDDLEGTNILITGAGGMLASYMVDTILYLNTTRFKKKATVFALVRDYEKARERFIKSNVRNNVRFIVQDIRETIPIYDKIDYIVHAASVASPKQYRVDPMGVLIPNTIGTFNCLEFARKNPVRSFLFFSSGEVYGSMDDTTRPITETSFGKLDPMIVRSCYSESKRMGETMCVAWLNQHGVPAKVVRPFHTYGPSLNLNDGRVFADFISDIVHKRNIRVKSDGLTKRTFCYISDATIAFFLILLKGISGEAYNVGGSKDNEINVGDLAKLLVSLYPEYGLQVIYDKTVSNGYIRSDYQQLIPDITKVRELGWELNIGLKNGFRKTIRSFLE